MNVSKTELQNIMDEYKLDKSKYDDEELEFFSKLDTRLETPEKIILYLYSELASERLLAEKLSTSRTTVRRVLQTIRKKLGVEK